MERWHYSAMNQVYEFSVLRPPLLPFEKFPNLKNVESIGYDQLGPLVSDRTRDVSQASRVASDLLFLEDGRNNFELLVRSCVYRHGFVPNSSGCSKHF